MSGDEEQDGPAKLDVRAAQIALRRAGMPVLPERPARTPDPVAVARARAVLARRQVPEAFEGAELADAPDDVRDRLAEWAADPGRRNLVLVGQVGRGKSHLAAAAVMAAYRLLGEPAAFRWTSVAALLDRSRPDGDDDGGPSLAVLRQVPVAVLDDVGAERATDWTAERLALLVDQRWSAGRPTVATTNLELGPNGSLAEHVGERTYSRLVGDGAVVVGLSGIDRRRGR